LLACLQLLYRPGIDRHFADVPEAMLLRYARRRAWRPPFARARNVEPACTLEMACFLRYGLLVTTDPLMVRMISPTGQATPNPDFQIPR
jgi:hypothetical protein